MPTISMFHEILILIYFHDNRRPHLPHIHVRYSGMKASIAIEDERVLAGAQPCKKRSPVIGGLRGRGQIKFAPPTCMA